MTAEDNIPEEPKSLLAEMLERREELLAKRERLLAPLNEQLKELDAAIAGLRDKGPDDYSQYDKPGKALFAYLNSTNTPHTRKEICRALVEKGYGKRSGKDADEIYWLLIHAVNYRIDHKRIKEINGLIGLSEWPKKMFGE